MKWTITLLPGDRVLAAPSVPVSEEVTKRVHQALDEWMASGKPVGIFGDDAEVVDRRTPPIQEQLDRIEAKLDALTGEDR